MSLKSQAKQIVPFTVDRTPKHNHTILARAWKARIFNPEPYETFEYQNLPM